MLFKTFVPAAFAAGLFLASAAVPAAAQAQTTKAQTPSDDSLKDRIH
jgi:hypothetical protein